MTAILFYIFAAVLVGASIFVVLNREPMYSVVMLVFAFANLAGMYFLLEAYFIGALQVLVYAGAIMVLFLFVVMLLDVKADEPRKGLIQFDRWWFGFLAVIFLGVLIRILVKGAKILSAGGGSETTEIGTVRSIGQALFTEYLLPFEIVSVLLTTALIGTVFLAKRKV